MKSIYIGDYDEDVTESNKRFLIMIWETDRLVKAKSVSTVAEIHEAIDELLRAK